MDFNKVLNIAKIAKKDYEEVVGALIYIEIESQVEISNGVLGVIGFKQAEELVKIGLEIYYNYDYSTPTGIGVVIANWLTVHVVEEENDFSEMDLNEVKTGIIDDYENSEWH